MAYGDAVVNPLPTPAVTTDWGDDLNLVLNEIIDCIEAKVTPAGMNMNADLDMNQHVVSDLGACRYTNQSGTLTTSSDTRKTYTVSGELYFTDGSQNAVKITNGGLLNSAATGGITGSGYGSAGVEVNWNAANTEYRLKNGAGADAYADLQTDTVRFNDGSANWVALDGPTGLSSNITFTLPSALPGSTSVVTSTSGGVLATTRDISVDSVTTTGDVTVGDDITCDDITCDAIGCGIVTTSAAAVKHAECVLSLSSMLFTTLNAETATPSYSSSNGGFDCGTSSGAAACGIPLLQGDRIKSISVTLNKNDTASTTVTFYEGNIGTVTTVSSASSTSSGDVTITISGLTTTVAANKHYFIGVNQAHGSDLIFFAQVTYDRV